MSIRRPLLMLILTVAWAAGAAPVAADCDPVGTPEEVLPTAEVAFVGRPMLIEGAIARGWCRSGPSSSPWPSRASSASPCS